MTRAVLAAGVGGAFVVASCLFVGAAQAAPALVTAKSLNLAAALRAAQAAFKACSDQGALVSVAVTDRSGNVLALLRDPLAGMHTPDAATRKAWTAISFRNTTSALERATGPASESNAIRQLPNVAMVGGGVPVVVAGEQVGAIGVSGAPNGAMDEGCARKGVQAIADELELGS
ncbi:MAG: heme-binding protein [Caldimonas sp.]